MASSREKQLHAIIIPIPHPGHINPTIDFALKLASTGFAITFVSLDHVHHQMMSKEGDEDIFSSARKSGLDIRHTTVSDGFPLEYDRVLHLEEYWESMLVNFPAYADKLVGRIVGANPDLTHFLVADTFFAWIATVAKKYNLVHVSFWTEPALVFSLLYHSDVLGERGHFPCKDDIEEDINYIPGIKSVNTKDFMTYLRESDVTSTAHKFVFTAFKEVGKVDFVLHNTVRELESETLSGLSEHQPHYAIGPVCFTKNLPTNIVHKNPCPEADCTQWLASKPPGSVLYVSFGSVVKTSRHIIEEIAYGLLLSEVKFIWVVRAGITGDDGANGLPEGFKDEIQEKGLIIPWCNQNKVLADPAVGGFLTHCGWNSIMESMWCGVPMICYPITYDQPTNRKLVVEDWKIGVNLLDGITVSRKEVAEKIRSAMRGPDSEKINQNVKAVRDQMRGAVETGGSSESNFDQFIMDLTAKIESTT